MAKHKENITDLAKFLEPPLLVYSTGDDEAAHRADNYGNEVMPFTPKGVCPISMYNMSRLS